jgi:hypothetical protein
VQRLSQTEGSQTLGGNVTVEVRKIQETPVEKWQLFVAKSATDDYETIKHQLKHLEELMLEGGQQRG